MNLVICRKQKHPNWFLLKKDLLLEIIMETGVQTQYETINNFI